MKDQRPISDLERYCLAITAEIDGRPCPFCTEGFRPFYGLICLQCDGSGKAPPEVIAVEEWVKAGETCGNPHCASCDAGITHPSGRTVYTSPLVRDAADMLEAAGDPGERFVALKEMKVIYNDTFHAVTRERWEVQDAIGKVLAHEAILADAVRELLRRALGVLMVECDCGCHDGWPSGQDKSKCNGCSGRGWLAAWTDSKGNKIPERCQRDSKTVH